MYDQVFQFLAVLYDICQLRYWIEQNQYSSAVEEFFDITLFPFCH